MFCRPLATSHYTGERSDGPVTIQSRQAAQTIRKRAQNSREPAGRKLRIEALEDRSLLSVSPTTQQAIQLFDASPALFVANQGQIAD